MANRLRLRPPENVINGSLPSRDLAIGKVPAPAGDPLAALFGMLAKRDPSSSVLQIQSNPARDLSQDQMPPRGGFCDTSGSQPAPPVSVLSVRRGSGPDTFHIKLEIHRSVAEWLGRVGSAFWPIFGAVKEERERERKQAERRARFDERMARFKRAGQVGFHRIRKAISPIHIEQILGELEDQYHLERPAVEMAISRHKAAFRKVIAKRRRAAIFRLKAAGMEKPAIAARCKISLSLVHDVLRGLRKK